jgi:hypothetical protein
MCGLAGVATFKTALATVVTAPAADARDGWK